MSESLQDWIFRQYIVHNASGESASISDLFSDCGLVPPGGTGECAAPKLLEYAYRNNIQPLAMGEFWYGRSPQTAVRTHGHFYPSCTSKCGPLLGYMMKGLECIETSGRLHAQPAVIYQDRDIIVAEKPSGMPSVPGLDGRESLQEWIGDCIPVHRLDMDTSGVIIFARNEQAAVNLRRQFEEHSIRKTYIARASGNSTIPLRTSGTIDLPLSPDYDERPRQKVDFQQGKEAHTDYKVADINPDGTLDLLLYPHTGRTHQLRVHCAHNLGLGLPILGDRLYGSASVTSNADTRLHLHALSITFRHPATEEVLTFSSDTLRY
jgi:tRNA pseudouridine32 synthase/23S rRNA pseudouridine746 synthase